MSEDIEKALSKSPIQGSATSGTGWSIQYECRQECWDEDHAVSLDFVISGADGKPLLKAFIKWDGCSNWMEPDGNYFHLCGTTHLEHLYDAMTMCYKIAGQYMPEAVE